MLNLIIMKIKKFFTVIIESIKEGKSMRAKMYLNTHGYTVDGNK